MTNPRDPDSGLEELLRSSLHGEAETISPSGDGLARIQQRTAARGRRLWLRPVAVVGGAAVAATAGFTAYAVTSAHQDGHDTLVSKQPTVIPSTPTASTSVTPSKTPVAGLGFPANAFYPFTSEAQEKSWEGQRGYVAQPWVTDPVAEAKRFIKSYVLADGVATTMGTHISSRTATVTLGRTISDGGSTHPVKVTTVQLQRFGKAWLVTGAADPNGNLKVSSPAAAAHVTSPLTVTGPSYGVDEAIHVDVATIGNRFSAASGQASFGNGSAPWSASVAFAPPADPRGAIVVTEDSAADGGPAPIVANAVTFDAEQTGYPAYFYAVKNKRVTKYASRNGASVSYLSKPAPAPIKVSDPTLVCIQIY